MLFFQREQEKIKTFTFCRVRIIKVPQHLLLFAYEDYLRLHFKSVMNGQWRVNETLKEFSLNSVPLRKQSTWMTHKLNKKERENNFNNWWEKPAVGWFLQAAQLTTNSLCQLHSKATTVFTKVHETYCPSRDDMFQIRSFGQHSYSIQLSIQNVIAIKKSSFPRNPRKVNLPEGGKI